MAKSIQAKPITFDAQSKPVYSSYTLMTLGATCGSSVAKREPCSEILNAVMMYGSSALVMLHEAYSEQRDN